MWGSSFAELARKAQEAASSASNELANIPTTGISLFNLDSILQQEEKQQPLQRHADRTNKTTIHTVNATDHSGAMFQTHTDKEDPPENTNRFSGSFNRLHDNENNKHDYSNAIAVQEIPITKDAWEFTNEWEDDMEVHTHTVEEQLQEEAKDEKDKVDNKQEAQNGIIFSSPSITASSLDSPMLIVQPSCDNQEWNQDTFVIQEKETDDMEEKTTISKKQDDEKQDITTDITITTVIASSIPLNVELESTLNMIATKEEVEQEDGNKSRLFLSQTTIDPSKNEESISNVVSSVGEITQDTENDTHIQQVEVVSHPKDQVVAVVDESKSNIENLTITTTDTKDDTSRTTPAIDIQEEEAVDKVQEEGVENNQIHVSEDPISKIQDEMTPAMEEDQSVLTCTAVTILKEEKEVDPQEVLEGPILPTTSSTIGVEMEPNTPVRSTVTEPIKVEKASTTTPSSSSSSRVTPEADVIAQAYMLQMQRLESQHELEIQEYQQRISTLESQLTAANKKLASSTPTSNSISIHDKCLAQLRKLEREYTTQLQQKEDALIQAQLVIETMNSEVQSLKKNHQFNEDSTIKYNQAMTENEFLKCTLSTSTVELEKYKEQYESLKSRAKAVAIELRDKREEVKVVGDENNDLRTMVQSLEQNNLRLESQLTLQSKILEERNEEIASLHSRMSSLQEEQQKSIQSYKKKAQESLSSANARLTTLSQAKDVADSALIEAQSHCQRVMKECQEERDAAILESQQTLSQSLKQVDDLKKENDELIARMTVLDTECKRNVDTFHALEEKHEVGMAEMAKVRQENSLLRDNLIVLSNELTVEKVRSNELLIQIQEHDNVMSAETENEKSRMLLEAKRKITLMEQELCEKQALIDDLTSKINRYEIQDEEMDEVHEPQRSPRKSQFYFVMEKQAELDTIREEVNRLASLISDAESSKVAAIDAMEIMRRRMEEAESRLRRHEKLSGVEAASMKQGESASLNHPLLVAKSDPAVNVEYLKNIILNYIHAKTLNERKTLLPVLCALLELTSDERAQALQSIEGSADIQTVGVSVIENIQNKGFVHGLLGW